MGHEHLSKRGIITPGRKAYGTERITSDPTQDDTQEVAHESMKEGKQAGLLRQGYSTIPLPVHKGVDHSTASEGKLHVGKPWSGPKGR